MVVNATVKRSDLVWFQIAFLFRIRANLIWFGLILVVAAFSARELLVHNVLLFFGLTLVVAVFGFLLLFCLGIVIQLIFASKSQGFIGEHRFEIRDDGFFEQTEGTETITRWAAIRRVICGPSFTYIQISMYRVHVIPRRAFDSDEEYEKFGRELVNRVG